MQLEGEDHVLIKHRVSYINILDLLNKNFSLINLLDFCNKGT